MALAEQGNRGVKLLNMGRPLKTTGKKRLQLMVPVTVGMHARLKHRAALEGRSMASIVRELVDGYLGEVAPPEPDVYDEITERIQRGLEKAG